MLPDCAWMSQGRIRRGCSPGLFSHENRSRHTGKRCLLLEPIVLSFQLLRMVRKGMAMVLQVAPSADVATAKNSGKLQGVPCGGHLPSAAQASPQLHQLSFLNDLCSLQLPPLQASTTR